MIHVEALSILKEKNEKKGRATEYEEVQVH